MKKVSLMLLITLLSMYVNAQHFPLSIDHALGTIELTKPATRVVTLEWAYTEDVLALGVQPVGGADIENYQEWVRGVPQLAADVTDVGRRQEPNLEKIATLQPDLIIAPSFRVAQTYEALNAIAPTLVFDAYPSAEQNKTQYESMIETFETIAFALGKQTEAQAILQDLNTHFEQAKERLSQTQQTNNNFVLAQAFSSGGTPTLRLFTENSLAVSILENIGFTNAWDDGFQLYGFSTIGIEGLSTITDVNFFYIVQDDDNIFLNETVAPLWNALDFVKNGNAHSLGGDVWLFGGPLSARELVNTVLAALE